MKKITLVVGHITEITGPGHHLVKFLTSLSNRLTYVVFHPMPGSQILNSQVTLYNNEKRFKELLSLRKKSGLVKQLLYDTIISFKQIIAIPGKIDLYVGLNNFDTFPAIFFKGWKIKKVIYYGSDYSDVRFTNPILNTIYRLVEIIVLKFCDLSVSNTNRALERRCQLGLNSNKAIMISNGVDLSQIPKVKKKPEYKFVYQGYLSMTHGIIETLDSLKKLKEEYPSVKLAVVGVGPDVDAIKRYIENNNLQKSVSLMGRLSHSDMLRFLKEKCEVGIASYTARADWVRYGSPLKVKEYLACDMAVIMSDVPEIAEDVSLKKMGIVYTSKKELYEGMRAFCRNKDLAKACIENGKKYIKQFDWVNMYDCNLKQSII